MLYADSIWRPRIEGLGHVLAEQERWRSKQHEPAQRSTPKGTHLQNAGDHIAGKHTARRIHSAELTNVSGAEIRINLVVRRRQIELRPSPQHVAGKEHP